ANNLSGLINRRGTAPFATERPEVLHHAAAVEECVGSVLLLDIRIADYLAGVVDSDGSAIRAPKRSEVFHLTIRINERVNSSLPGFLFGNIPDGLTYHHAFIVNSCRHTRRAKESLPLLILRMS